MYSLVASDDLEGGRGNTLQQSLSLNVGYLSSEMVARCETNPIQFVSFIHDHPHQYPHPSLSMNTSHHDRLLCSIYTRITDIRFVLAAIDRLSQEQIDQNCAPGVEGSRCSFPGPKRTRNGTLHHLLVAPDL